MESNQYVVLISKDIGYYFPDTETLWAGVTIEQAGRYDKKTALYLMQKLIEAGYEEALVLRS